MKLKEIHRTSTFAWSVTPSLPLIATGTVAGALDESFSNESQLEIWAPDFMDKHEYDLGVDPLAGPKGIVTDTSRFNRLAWGYVNKGRQHGVIAAGMENGELALWDPSKILANVGASESLIMRNTSHTGPIRGLDFNPIQTNLLSSGAVNGEVYIWDLNDPSKPYSPTPGTRSTKLDEITSVAWNQQVQYVLAGASSTGYTVVWDLRGKREVVALAYGGGAGTLAGQSSTGSGLAVGGRRGMSAIAWHPDNATRLVTASEDDLSPVIMVWDLRNARAPEKILTGHEKGVLSLSWCKQDADLLLSCGKDNRALCWNPQTSAVIGELPSADNWAFQVEWCPRNPDLLATAFFDGTVGIHSIQSTNEAGEVAAAATPKADGADIFDVSGYSRGGQHTLSLKQPPKWLRRPISSSFGFGGQLVSVSNLASAQGKNQSSVVHLRKVVAESDVVERVQKLEEATAANTLSEFAEQRSQEMSARDGDGVESWKALLSLFRANSRDELVTLLGYSKEEVAMRVQEAVAKLKETAEQSSSTANYTIDEEDSEVKPHEPVVSFAEPEREASPEGSDHEDPLNGTEKTPSELSASAASDGTSGTQLADGESTTTAPSLFGDDNAIGTPQMDGDADFFSTMGIPSQTGNEQEVVVPHHNYGLDSSVAATVGSGPSSVTSDNLKSNNFRIYPSDESETDRLITKALVLGDFESAVSLCLSSDRFADAILLAIKGGQDLLQRTQKAYFEHRTASLPYLRLFQSIVTNDLTDIVQNADLQEWQEIFVVLCTFATQEEFSNLAEQLGRRLEFQSSVLKASNAPNALEKSIELRKNATLTYLAAGRLERLVNIWIEESAEEEKQLIQDQEHLDGSRYTAHAHALQTFIEKVTVFRSAIKYVDTDLSQAPGEDSDAKTYKLAGLYDRYFEYGDLLAAQGLVKEAITYLKLTPSDYSGSVGAFVDFQVGRERLLIASGVSQVPAAAPSTSRSIPVATSVPALPDTGTIYPYVPYVPAAVSQTRPYDPTRPPSQPQYQPAQSAAVYNPSNAYTPQTVAKPALLTPAPAASLAPPARRPTHTPAPPPKRHENGGWNDAPVLSADRRGPNSVNKPQAITSPFPNATPPPGVVSPGPGSPFHAPSASLAPPRPASVQSRPPPPPQGQRMHAAPPMGSGGAFPPQARPPSGPPSHPQTVPPPSRMIPPPPGPYGPPPSQASLAATAPGPYARATPPPGPPRGPHPPGPPPGPYARSTPPPGQAGPPMPQQGPYNVAPSGTYPPSQGAPRATPPTQPHAGLPPPPQGLPAPPPGNQIAAPPRVQRGPPAPKYPPGDRSHIPAASMPIFDVVSEQLTRLKQTIPPQQKRIADDLERRINPLFDALNCETLSKPVVDQLLVLIRAMQARDRDAALAIHVDLLTRGSQTDDIGLWMSAIKQLIMRL
ncbi:hypothetical protein SERLA73DRAFT_165175 [Serpula lacrymans var. lacrymans S7.3]|uniref:Protein transport protein SEC31 n=1 Tax=Serpula lacrymans var. lacrymans (strain S7.3) TaxID=936435 RepID=F8PJT7_SERL3|nr:hypothetical protein SERLA73DRAFT_165175 [Serpula lacrymans var. lacrymans S7.3]